MSVVNFVRVNAGDRYCNELAGSMRQTDAEEVRLSHDMAPGPAVEYSVRRSPAFRYAAVDNGKTLCLFGVSSTAVGAHGSPWLLATDKYLEHKREILSLSRPMVEEMSKRYTVLENWVWADNLVSIRWLEFCGFNLDEPQKYGLHGAMFRRFWRIS